MTYLDLVEQLLKSPLGEEQQILNDNRNLIDADLTQHMLQVADDLLKQGDFSNADRLMNLAGQLLGAYSNASAATASETNYDFLNHILQAIFDSNANSEVVYPLLQANLDQLDDHFADKLRCWAAEKLLEADACSASAIAQSTGDIGNLMYQFPLGSKASNLEIAIASYEVAASIFTHEAFPQKWATIQGELGNAYCNRIKHEKADNLERSIAYYQSALQIFTHETFPQKWATIQMNLGTAYCNRIKHEKVDNLEQSIVHYQLALQIFTREAFPQNWATTQMNLSNAYCNRIKHEKADNLEQAVVCCQSALQVFTREAFPQDWAKTQMNLGNAYFNRIREEQSENLEQAIACCYAALQVFTHKLFPQDWAVIQNNLGSVYSKRLRDGKPGNLERAIVHCRAALQVFTPEAFPQDWAKAQRNLGLLYSERTWGERAENLELEIAHLRAFLQVSAPETDPRNWAEIQYSLGKAYSERIRGKQANNLELAIAHYQFALQVFTREAFPEVWAEVQCNIGNAYGELIWKEQAGNLEQAIVYYQSALQIFTRETFPQDWATIQMNLGNAYSNRIREKQSENLELAIAYCQSALQVFTPESFPKDWAMVQINLGKAYSDRIRGEQAENLEQAIAYCQSALQVFTPELFPQYWAMIQINLGVAHWHRFHRFGRRGEDDLEQAIAYCQSALQIFTREEFPQEWARTQMNLGNFYRFKGLREQTDNLEQAIAYCESALQVFTRESCPQYWSTIQMNLGLAYSSRIQGEQTDNLEKAIAHNQSALQVFTCEAFPQKQAETLLNLGIVYQSNNQSQLAYSTFATAIETAELLRSEIISGDEAKQKLAEEHNAIYCEMVNVCLKLEKFTQAFEYIERSKTRNLVELILQRDLHSSFPSDVASQLEQLRDEIASGQSQLQHSQADDPVALAQRLRELRQQRNDLQDHYLPIGSSFRVDHFQKQSQTVLDDQTAVIEWYIAADNFLAFTLTSEAEKISVWQSTTDDRKALIDWVNAYLNDYFYSKANWRNQLTNRLEELAMILHLDELIQQLPESCNRLILIPHQVLHILPLHALPLNHQPGSANNPKLLMDRFPRGVSYAPSCQLLLQAQQRQRPNFTHLFAIQNPTGDLTYADLEVQAITPYFPSTDVHKHAEATLAAIHHTSLNTAHCVHFGCHGSFNLTNPRHSALSLANAPPSAAPAQSNSERYLDLQERGVHNLDQCLTLDAIFSLNLSQCRLVTLSACETGLIDFNNLSDEYIGLPSGFLVAGSPAVVSSLWKVDDLSTSFLMIKFYEILTPNPQQGAIAIALNQAQQWLRTLTIEGSKQFLNNHKSQLKGGQFLIFMEYLKQIEHYQHPFANPYYWAAFTATGL